MKLPETWSEIGFEVEITGDGSPSLRLLQAIDDKTEKGESMHHSGGAAEETELIYGRVIHECFNHTPEPHFLSVGLGLGYVELTIAREALLKRNLNFSIESFELVPELKFLFQAWLKGESLSSEIQNVYDLMAQSVLKTHFLELKNLKSLLNEKQAQQRWRLQGPLLAQSPFLSLAHGILFDAFSSKTSPDLWTEEFLVDFFTRASANDSVISTYACRGTLKRALKQSAFAVQIREGFKGKRNSTLAWRLGVLSGHPCPERQERLWASLHEAAAAA